MRRAIDAGTSPPVGNADRGIASLRPQFTACYRDALNADRELDGCVGLFAEVSPDGSVVSAEPLVHQGLTPAVLVRKAHIQPIEGTSRLFIPVTFVQTK